MAAAEQTHRVPEPFEVPEGGLASFLTATVGDWAEADNDDYIPPQGIAQVKSIAEKLAEYGRYEDEYMVHAAEGETVIPAEVLDANPRLKANLFRQMREMGIDPERYVVGSELNSINPVTGQPEFFLKKLFKGVKKLVKGVVKVFKKVAPIVLGAIGASFGPLGAALGSGIGTLIQGGDLKDALKAGLIAGVTAGIGQGLSEGFTAAKAGAATGFGNVGEFASGFGQSVSQGLQGGYIDQFAAGMSSLSSSASDILNKFSGNTAPTDTATSIDQALASARLQPGDIPGSPLSPGAEQFAAVDNPLAQGIDRALSSSQPAAVDVLAPGGVENVLGIPAAQGPSFVQQVAQQTGAAVPVSQGNLVYQSPDYINTQAAQQTAQPTGYFDRLRQDPLGTLTGSSAQPTNAMLREQQLKLMSQFGINATDALTMAQKQLAPSLFQKYGTAAAVAAGLGAATGAFDTPPPPEPIDYFGGVTGADLLAQDPSKYRVGLPTYGQGPEMAMPSGDGSSTLSGFGPDVTVAQAMGQGPRLIGYDAMGNPMYEEQNPLMPYDNPMYQPPVLAAKGGEIEYFPRRMGAIYGPGTGTSDDVPAMLSDGEFVMTARAVRNAGNGDRERGMMRMYDIMRKFEGGRV
jgi:hypothetical protein